MSISEELAWRGQIKDKTFEEISWLDSPKTFYLGVDCTSADSLTIGNLAVFMLARRLVDAGWKAVLLVGGATSLIGDPGGKDSERELTPQSEIEKNVKGIAKQVNQLFSEHDFTLVNNFDWFKSIGYLEFLRDVGKHYSMTELLQRDFIAQRIGEGNSGISYAEFSYSLIQGYDYWHLFKNHGVELQIGGSDQWGNMLSGVPLIRKKEDSEVHALSAPLVINKQTGKKFGKSEDGAVWLDESKTSVFKFYQFWLNVDDQGVEDYLKIYTLLTKADIENILLEFNQDKSGRLAQKTLAYEVTKLVHGTERADSLVHMTEVLFDTNDFASLSAQEIADLGAELPFSEMSEGTSIIDALVETGLASSKGEGRRFVQSGGVYVNGKQIDSDKNSLVANDTIHEHVILKRGKNTLALIKLK